MSKFLKFIVHFIVICTILCVVALAVPPFFGVTTKIMDDTSQATNLPIGSVTYAIPVKTAEVQIGDPILVTEDSKVYRYNIATTDLENGICTVFDPSVSNPKSITVKVQDYVPKIVITVGYLGYLLVATESIEGLIILGLAVLFLIILFVIAELWKKEPQEAAEEEEPQAGYVKSKKELKQEEKERARRMKEEERQIKKDEKSSKKAKKANKKTIRTGGFVDEIYEEDLEPEAEMETPRPVNVQSATSEAHELLKKEIAAATAEEAAPVEELQPVKEETVPVVEQVKEPEPEEEAPVDVKKMAIPLLSAAQLADAAKRQGDAPEIVKDDITKVTLFDYSDIIGEDPAEETKE